MFHFGHNTIFYLKNTNCNVSLFFICRKSLAINTLVGSELNPNLKNCIPVPPLSEQERIVSILDKFDALANDISIGLPAEIQARQKQYEYYRDKLLSFKEAANEQL